MTLQESFLEKSWDDLLSRNNDRIIARFVSLDSSSQKTVLDHLRRMTTESGWHPEQVRSALSALQALTDQENINGH